MLSIRSWSWTPDKTTAIATSPAQQTAQKKKRHAVKDKLRRLKFCLCQKFGCKKHTPTQTLPSPPSSGAVSPSNLNKELPPIRQHSFTVSFESVDRGPGSNDAIRLIAGSHGASLLFGDNGYNREGGKGDPRSKVVVENGGSGAWSPPSSTGGYHYNHSDNDEQRNKQNQVDQHHHQSLNELYDRLPNRRDSRILPIETLDAMYGDSSTAGNGNNGGINNATGRNSAAAWDQSREGPPPYESPEPTSHLPGGDVREQHPVLRGGHADAKLGAELEPQASSPVSARSNGHMMGDIFDSGPSNLPESELTLWDRAYENLKAHKTKCRLIDRYERLLSQQMARNTPITDKLYRGILNDGDGDDDDDDTAYPANCISADPRGRHVQLTNMVKQCRKMQKDLIRPTLYAVGGIVSFFDDWITDAVQGSSMASTIWAGVSLCLPLLTNPKKQVDEQLKALTYVTARVSYYEKLELAIGRLPKMDAGVRHEVKARFVKLYQAMIEVLVTGVVHAFGSFKTYLKDALGLGDWKASIARIKALEKTFDNDLSMFRSLMDGEALASLERQAKVTSRAMDTLQSIAQESLQQMRLSTVIAQDGLRMQQEDRDAAARKDDMLCLQAFAPEASSGRKTYVDLKDSLAEAVPGTCQWFLRQDKVGAWLRGEKSESVLFLTAGPGCGKSVLSKHMVDSVIRMEDPSATVCYFFFMERVQDSLAQALSSLLHQLLSKNDALIKHAREPVKKHKDIAKSPSLLWDVFQKVVNDPESGRLVFVIDALDECDISDLENLVRRLKKLVTTTACRGAVRFLLTSRPWAHVNKAYRPLKNYCIEISGDDFAPEIEHEVGLVTEARIEDFCEGLAGNTRAYLRQKLVGQRNATSGRTYLWVHLVFEYLNQTNPIQCTARGLERTLQHLPTTVEDAYANLLEQSLAKVNNREMQDLVVDLVRRAFSIVLAARRPLAVEELREALAMEGGETSLASLDLEEPNEAFANRLNQCCGLMLSFASGTVTFIHQTVIEFLLQSEHPHPRQNTVAETWRHSFSSQQAHLVLVQVCMNFLLLDEFCSAAAHAPTSLPRNRDTVTSSTAHHPVKSPLFDAHPFMSYAGCFWDYHFRLSNAQQDQALRDQALRLCDIRDFGPRLWILHDCCQHHTARQQLNYDAWHWFDGTFFLFSQLWLYAFAGLDFAVQATLQERQRELEAQAQTQAQEGAQGASMVVAAAAAVSTRDTETLKTALLIAAVNGHTSTMELLRTHGADLNMKFTNKWSSNIRGGKAATLLHLIAQCGDDRTLPCLQYLLHAGANVTMPNFRGRTPLHELRHPAVAKLILQYSNRQDLDRRDKQGRTPLRSQLELIQRYGGGDDQGQEIVALMLAHGASVEERPGNGLSPARTSETVLMQTRDVGVAELLLSQGADIDATDDEGRTFLMLIVADNEGLAWWDPHGRSRQDMALRINRRAVIKLLLARGANVSLQDHRGNSALSLAHMTSDMELLNGHRSRRD